MPNFEPTVCEKCPFLKGSNEDLSCSLQDISLFEYEVIPYENGQTISFKDKICQYKRDENWANKSLKRQAREEVKIKYDVVTICNDPTDIHLYFNHFNQSTLPPKEIILYINSGAIYKECMEVRKEYAGTNLTLAVSVDSESRYQDIYLSQTNSRWVVFVDDKLVPKIGVEFFNWLDKQINDYGFRFRFIEGTLSMFSTMLYTMTNIPYRGIIEKMPHSPEHGFFTYEEMSEAFNSGKNWDLKSKSYQDPT